MEKIAQDYLNCAHAVLYVREAHPGADIPAHKAMEDKRNCATLLKSEFEDPRTIFGRWRRWCGAPCLSKHAQRGLYYRKGWHCSLQSTVEQCRNDAQGTRRYPCRKVCQDEKLLQAGKALGRDQHGKTR